MTEKSHEGDFTSKSPSQITTSLLGGGLYGLLQVSKKRPELECRRILARVGTEQDET